LSNLHSNPELHQGRLQTATTATTLAASGVRWGWSHILNAANLHAGASQGTESGLSTWTWSLGAVTTSGTDLDVESVDAKLLAADGNILSSQHGGVWRRLVTVGLDLHATGNTDNGFTATGITQTLAYQSESFPQIQVRSWA
jgi:hypothetical protein